jgi:hypothetical protein
VILPTKRLSEDRSLLGVGADLLRLLDQPKTVSRLWEEMQKRRQVGAGVSKLPYDWFILSLDLLYAIGAVELRSGRISRRESESP